MPMGFKTLVSNFDGPYYVAVARTFYDKQLLRSTFSFPVPLEYFPAHFPLFPIVIRGFSLFTGYGYGMLAATLFGSILAVISLFELLKNEGNREVAFFGALVFLIFPARWLVVRTIGSPEPWFVFFILTSLLYFRKGNFFLSGILGALATLTKSPGILLFIAYFLCLVWDKTWQDPKKLVRALPILLIPLALGGLFGFYFLQTGDFWAYFNSGDNIHLTASPFGVFNSQKPWVGTYWLEEVIYIYLIGGLTLIELIRQKRGALVWFSAVFLASLIFVSHRDLGRYAIPLGPLAIVAFAPILRRKEIRLLFLVLAIPIYLYAVNFIRGNVLGIADWTPFL